MTRAARASWRILGPLHSLFLLTALALMLALGACATGPVTPSGSLAAAYDSLKAYNGLVAQTLERGRINAAQGGRALDAGRDVRLTVDKARDALTVCGNKLPCESFEAIMARVQPLLLELERKLREEEAAKK